MPPSRAGRRRTTPWGLLISSLRPISKRSASRARARRERIVPIGTEDLGRLVVAHFFETYEQHHFAPPLGEMAKCAVELAQLPRSRRISRGYERRRQLIDVDVSTRNQVHRTPLSLCVRTGNRTDQGVKVARPARWRVWRRLAGRATVLRRDASVHVKARSLKETVR